MPGTTAVVRAHETEPDPGRIDDASLVARVVGGERLAFEVLYQRHKTPLYRTAMAVTRDAGAAEDLLQEAFLRAYRHIGHVQIPSGGSLGPWLHRILINLAYDWSARERRHGGPLDVVTERLLAAPGAASPERQAEQREVQRIVGEAVEALPFKHRIVVILFYVQDMDLSEIAALLNVPPGTVKSRLYYARGRLRQLLENDARLPRGVEVTYAPA